jgi:hypothetical protein
VKIEQHIIQRMDALIAQGEEVLKTREAGFSSFSVDASLAPQWGISCLNLLRLALDKTSDHYLRFNDLYSELTAFRAAEQALGILKGAKDDYEHGYIFEARTLIQAEVFEDFLEQAEHLLSGQYSGPAAVVAGCVLEDGLRKLCTRHGIALAPKPKLDTMNAELAKTGVYSGLVQKQITALADLRNKAAHGQWAEFSDADVRQMIMQVRNIMAQHFGTATTP